MTSSDVAQLHLATIASAVENEEIVQEDWADTLCSAPGILHIMGEAMVLASVPNAAQVRFSQQQLSDKAPSSLIAATLPASLYECNQMGGNAFLTAHTGMTKINMHAQNLLPTIDSIVNVFQQPRTATTKALLALHVKKLTKAAGTCTETSLAIQKRFEDWKSFTEELARCVVRNKDDAHNEKLQRDDEILLQDNAIELAEKEENNAKAAVEEAQLKFDRAVESQRAAERNAQAAFEAAEGCVMFGPQGAVLGAAFVGIGTIADMSAQKMLQTAEQEASEKRKVKEEQGKRRMQLVNSMRVLQNKQTTLKEITRILHKALCRLNQLQANISQLLIFFTKISDYVELLKGNIDGDGGFVSQLAIPVEIDLQEGDRYLDQAVRDQALEAKLRFVIMSRISQAYSQVSTAYIMPGFRIIDKMALGELALTNSDVSARSSELSNYNNEATRQIRSVVLERQGELQTSILQIVQEIARPIFGG